MLPLLLFLSCSHREFLHPSHSLLTKTHSIPRPRALCMRRPPPLLHQVWAAFFSQVHALPWNHRPKTRGHPPFPCTGALRQPLDLSTDPGPLDFSHAPPSQRSWFWWLAPHQQSAPMHSGPTSYCGRTSHTRKMTTQNSTMQYGAKQQDTCTTRESSDPRTEDQTWKSTETQNHAWTVPATGNIFASV